jgi:hypothetical protein
MLLGLLQALLFEQANEVLGVAEPTVAVHDAMALPRARERLCRQRHARR